MKTSRMGMGQYNSRAAAPAYASYEKPIEDKEIEQVLPPKSTFRLAIQNQQQGIAYLIIDNGYDYMLAT